MPAWKHTHPCKPSYDGSSQSMNKQSQFRILEEVSYQLVVRDNGRARARKAYGPKVEMLPASFRDGRAGHWDE